MITNQPTGENNQMFPHDLSLIDRLVGLDLSWADPILSEYYSRKHRRPPHPPLAMLRALVYQHIKQIPSWRQLARHIQTDKTGLCVALGFRMPPHHSAISAFTKRIGPEGMHRIFKELVRRIGRGFRNANPFEPFANETAIDSTLVRAHCRKPRKGYRKSDPDALWGVRGKLYGKPEYVHGYKLHVCIDADRELPLSYSVHPANKSDSTMFRPELKSIIDDGYRPQFVEADAAYDSMLNIAFCYKDPLKAVPVIALNPRRARGKARLRRTMDVFLPFKREGKQWKEHYAKRTSVERVFARLKTEFGLAGLKVRRLPRVSVHFGLCLIALLCMTLAAQMNGRIDLMLSPVAWRY